MGDLGAWRDGHPIPLGGEKPRTVLGVLAVQPGVWVRCEAIAEAVWDGALPDAAQNLVQTYISRLRRVLAPRQPGRPRLRLLESMSGSYRLEIGDGQLDLLAFRKLAAAASAASAAGLSAACGLFDQALSLAPGVPLADLPVLANYPPRTAIAEHLASVVVDYAETAAALGCGQERAIPHLRALLRREPLNEKAAACLMQALAAEGQQAAALQVYAETAALLDAELGVRPGQTLMRMQLRVLRRKVPPPGQEPGPAASGDRLWAGRQLAPRQLPAPPRHLIGRVRQLRALSRLAGEAEHAGAVAVISGTAGIGKTALAVHWAHQAADRFPDGQLYINLRGFDPAGSPLTPGQVVRGFLDALGVPADRVPGDPDAQIGLYRSILAVRRVLIVLDNAADAGQVRPLLPGGAGCLVIATSRRQLDGLVATDGAQAVRLRMLTEDESRQLLASFVGAARVAAEPAEAADLIRICAGLPLAMCVAGARAQGQPGFPLATLVAELRDARQRLDGLDAGDAAVSLRTAFFSSYRQLGKNAARAFRLVGMAPGPDIAGSAAASLLAEPPRHSALALAELTRSNLLAEHSPGRYALHDLLRAYATEQCRKRESAAERRAALRRLFDYYLHTAHAADRLLFPNRPVLALGPPEPGVTPARLADPASALAWFQAEHRVLLAATTDARDQGSYGYAWQLSCCLAMFLDTRGYWHDFRAAQTIAVDAAGQLGDSAALARSHHALAHACVRLGDDRDAEDQFTAALQLYRELGNHAGQGGVFIGLGQLAQGGGDYAGALRLTQHAAYHYEAAGQDVGRARALNQSGFALAHLGDLGRALADCSQAVELYRELAAAGTGPAEAWDSLGYVYHLRGEYRQAVLCYQRAVGIFQQLDDTYDQATVLIHLGDTQVSAGRRWAGRAALRRALAILSELNHHEAAAVEARLMRL
jgi:DNA-binding SARP family transcriptional activator/tetratricopeptide (TPR) repeat protein